MLRHALAALALAGVAYAGSNEDALIKADTAFAAMAKAKGAVAAYTAYAAPDLRMFDDGEGIVTGMPNIVKVLKGVYLENGTVDWKPTEAVASDDGTMGFTVGEWTYKAPDDLNQNGWYLTVWRKQKDGSWKVSVDADTTEINKQEAR